MNIIAVKSNILFGRVLSALPSEQSRPGDIILRALIGMAFITAMIWLAAIIAGKIGRSFHPTGWLADREEDEAENENTGNNENNDIGGNING